MEHFDVSVVQPLVGKGHEGPIVYAERGRFIEVLWHYRGKLVDSRCHQNAVNQPTEQHFSNIFAKERKERDIPEAPDSLDNMLKAVPASCPMFDFNSLACTEWAPRDFVCGPLAIALDRWGEACLDGATCAREGVERWSIQDLCQSPLFGHFRCLPSSSHFLSAPTTTVLLYTVHNTITCSRGSPVFEVSHGSTIFLHHIPHEQTS